MSLAELKQQAVALPVEQQAELLSFLAERFRCEDADYRAEMARLIDDRNPANWVKWADLKKELDAES